MDNSFFIYLQQLEILVFFSGYPLIYLLVQSIVSIPSFNENVKKRLWLLLPYAYALAGILFLGFELKNMFPDFSAENIAQRIRNPFLFCWGLLSIAFWIPALRRIPVLAFIHSLVFFYPLVIMLFQAKGVSFSENDSLKNFMRIYTISILLYSVILAVLYAISFLLKQKKSNPSSF